MTGSRLAAAIRGGLETISVAEVESPSTTTTRSSSSPRTRGRLVLCPKLRDGYTQYVGMTPIVWDFHVSAEEHAGSPTPLAVESADTIVVNKEPFPVKTIRASPPSPHGQIPGSGRGQHDAGDRRAD